MFSTSENHLREVIECSAPAVPGVRLVRVDPANMAVQYIDTGRRQKCVVLEELVHVAFRAADAPEQKLVVLLEFLGIS